MDPRLVGLPTEAIPSGAASARGASAQAASAQGASAQGASAQGASAESARGASAASAASARGASAESARGASAASAASARGASAAPPVSLIDMENRIDLIIFYTLDQIVQIVPNIPNEAIDTLNTQIIQTEIDRLNIFFPNMNNIDFPNNGRVGNLLPDASRNSTLFTLFERTFTQIRTEKGIRPNPINKDKLKKIKRLIKKTINPPVVNNAFNEVIVKKYFTIFIKSVIQLFEHPYFHFKLEQSPNYLKNFTINLALSILNEMAYVSSDNGQYLKWIAGGDDINGQKTIYKKFVQWTCSMIIQQFGTINKPNLVSINLPKIGDIVDTSNSYAINSIFYDVKTSLTSTYPSPRVLIMGRKDNVLVSPIQNPIFTGRRKLNIDHPIGLTPNNKLNVNGNDHFVKLLERPDDTYIPIDRWNEHNQTDYSLYAEEIMICFEHLSNILNKNMLLYEHNSRRVILNIPKYLKLMKLQMNIRNSSGNYTPDVCIQWWSSPIVQNEDYLNQELSKNYTFENYVEFSISNWHTYLPSALLAASSGNAPLGASAGFPPSGASAGFPPSGASAGFPPSGASAGFPPSGASGFIMAPAAAAPAAAAPAASVPSDMALASAEAAEQAASVPSEAAAAAAAAAPAASVSVPSEAAAAAPEGRKRPMLQDPTIPKYNTLTDYSDTTNNVPRASQQERATLNIELSTVRAKILKYQEILDNERPKLDLLPVQIQQLKEIEDYIDERTNYMHYLLKRIGDTTSGQQKYLKYKAKYLQLKKLMNNMKL
jgi:hypothetical protein